LYVTGWKNRGCRGQLNDPCAVARRHRGWMGEINGGIHPWRRREGVGKSEGEAEGKKERI